MAHVTGVNIEQPTYDAVIKKTFTKINGCPSRRNRDNLLVEVEKFLVCVSVSGFDWASKYGLLAKTRGGTEWEQLTGKVYEEPSNEEPADTRPHIKKKWKEEKKERKKSNGKMTRPRPIRDLEHEMQCVTTCARYCMQNIMNNSKMS